MMRYPLPLEVREVPLLEGELLVECRIAEDTRYVWLVARGDDGHSRIFQFYSILRGREWFRAQVRTIKRGISEAELGGFDPKTVQEITKKHEETVNKYVKYVKQVVASLRDGATGEPIHHRKWDSAVLDLPVVNQKEQRRPSLKAKTINQLVQESEGDEQALYVLLLHPECEFRRRLRSKGEILPTTGVRFRCGSKFIVRNPSSSPI